MLTAWCLNELQRIKRWLITVEHYSSIIATSGLGVRKISVTEGASE